MVCERLVNTLGLKKISVGQSIRLVQDELGWTELAALIDEKLTQGEAVPWSWAAQCTEAASLQARSVTQGFVLDGFPNTIAQMKELASLQLVPYFIVSIDCSLDTCIQHLQGEVEGIFSRPTFSPEFLTYKYNEWKQAHDESLPFFQSEYNNVEVVDGEHSIWWVYSRVQEHIFSVMTSVSTYFKDIAKGKAARLHKICLTKEEFCEHQSEFKNYCPVCLKLKNHLVSENSHTTKEGLIQYLDKYYWVCSTHLELFKSTPEQYVPPQSKAILPEHLPVSINATNLSMQNIAKEGYCIVTYCDNLPHKCLKKGLPEYGVQYHDQLYLFLNTECQDRFMKSPDIYCEQEIYTLSTKFESFDVMNLPCMGFLEQTTVKLLNKAVTKVGIDRPKCPGLSLSASAAVYIGYILKEHNENTSADEKLLLQESLTKFLQYCQIARKMIPTTKKRNPFLSLGTTNNPAQV